jgi:UDP-2,3-diacylglucosamine pyrophosphatase LpxH
MRTDGLFDYRVVHIPGKVNEEIILYGIGDVHWNSPGFAREKFQHDMNEIREKCKKQRVYFILTGDIFESLSTSERDFFLSGKLHDSNGTRWEQEYAREIKQFAKECDFMIGRTIAVFGGNHYFQFGDGTTSDMALADELKAPYIGCSGYVILVLELPDKKSQVVKIFVHHGRSSGRKAGSTFNSLEDAACYFSDADILLHGHDHKAGAVHLPSLKCDMGMGGKWRIKDFDRILGRTGSYLKAYEPGKKSYAVDAMYRPSTLGCLELHLTPKRYTPWVGTNSNGKEIRQDQRWVEIKAVV